MRPNTLLVILILCLWPTDVLAATVSSSDTDGDATLFLAVEDTLRLNGPNPDWCLVSISVSGDDVPLTEGDSILVWVFEDDLVIDDLIFQAGIEVSPADVSSQYVERYFDCSGDPLGFQDGVGEIAEIYAEAVVRKEECGTFCIFDRPQTNLLDVLVLETTTGSPRARTAWLGTSHPNPFNPRTTISYSLGTAGNAELVVYDLAGRRVKTLVSGHVEAGRHEARWEGTDEQGRRVSSGVYLYRLVTGNFVDTKRMVLLK